MVISTVVTHSGSARSSAARSNGVPHTTPASVSGSAVTATDSPDAR
ncbi:hypothetical protein [Streptomyces profundus]|nr:hypothetical protein [Streptomyces sp. MA3_2.13]UED86616.1 hypothetical protein K4G22_22465 [Streptomyces sp. MA3_2.13]